MKVAAIKKENKQQAEKLIEKSKIVCGVFIVMFITEQNISAFLANKQS